MTVLIFVILFLCFALVCLGVDDVEQRIRARDAEDDLVLARDREDRLHDQVPYPMGSRLPE